MICHYLWNQSLEVLGHLLENCKCHQSIKAGVFLADISANLRGDLRELLLNINTGEEIDGGPFMDWRKGTCTSVGPNKSLCDGALAFYVALRAFPANGLDRLLRDCLSTGLMFGV